MESIMHFWGGVSSHQGGESIENGKGGSMEDQGSEMLANFLEDATFSGANVDELIDMVVTPTEQGPDTPIITVMPEDSLREFEIAKQHLMNLEFGFTAHGGGNSGGSSTQGWDYTGSKAIARSDDPDVSTTVLPAEYQSACQLPASSFPYQLNITDLPSFSRVETQIKINLQITPPPAEFLVHLPRDTIAKPKFILKNPTVPADTVDHLLKLDAFVVSSDSVNGDTVIKSCNVCKRCMRREMKRASRRKAGLIDESSNWDLNVPKRAIIFNSKEIISFPAPTADHAPAKNLELLSRIVCYCRHHQESSGFRLLFILKNGRNEILGRHFSDPIMIMDRKKAMRDDSVAATTNANNANNSTNNNNDSNNMESLSNCQMSDSSASAITPAVLNSSNNITSFTSSALLRKSSSISLFDDQPNELSNANSFIANNSQNALNMLLSHSIMGSADEPRAPKRQKRPWSPPENITDSYANNVNLQRHTVSNVNIPSLDPTNVNIKKEAVSPLTSDANSSPHNNITSSATSHSVFSLTPEKMAMHNNSIDSTTGLTPNYQINPQLVHSASSTHINSDAIAPVVQRIIPAQGPIRGGVEITLLGNNFHNGLKVKFGANISLATQCWSDTTIVTYLPPASQAGPVLVTFEDSNSTVPLNISTNSHQIFTYTDDTDRQLIELALQIVGLKMNGKLEDAKNIAKRIVGTNNSGSMGDGSPNSTSPNMTQQQQISWMATASQKMKELSKSSLDHESILLKFLSIIKLPNSPVSTPNWGVCNSEGQTILHLASFMNYDKLCKYLLTNGCKVDPRDINGYTPLHFAFVNGHRKIIEILSNFGARVKSFELRKIADSNVLDLLTGSDSISMRKFSSDSSVLEEEINSNECSNDTEENFSRLRKAKFDIESDIEADDEDYSVDELGDEDYTGDDSHPSIEIDPKETESINSKKTNPFGLNLWIAMKVAIVNKMTELGAKNISDYQGWSSPNILSSSNNVAEEDDSLPSYDDLFPDAGVSLRSLINFRGYNDDEEQDAHKPLVSITNNSQHLHDISLISESELDFETDELRLIEQPRKTLFSDWRLIVFWLPMMVALCAVVLGILEIPNGDRIADKIKTQLANLMIEQDKFTARFNANLNYGRHLLHDVNDAVLTAVGR